MQAAHPTVQDIMQIAQRRLQLHYGDIAQAARQKGMLFEMTYLGEASLIVENGWGPQQFNAYLHQQGAAAAAALPPLAVAMPPAAAAAALHPAVAAAEAGDAVGDAGGEQGDPDAAAVVPPGVEPMAAVMQQFATTLTGVLEAFKPLPQEDRPKGFPTVTTSTGMRYSPHGAVLVMFWVAMDVCFGLAGDQERRQLFSLHRAGSQGQMGVMEFAQHVMRLYESIEHLPEITPITANTVFVSGLNKESTRNRAFNFRADNPQVSLLEMAEELFRFEEAQLAAQQTALQATVYAGAAAGAVGAGRNCMLRCEDPAVIDMLAKCPAKAKQIMQLAVKLAKETNGTKFAGAALLVDLTR
jgi:hypothetical protein